MLRYIVLTFAFLGWAFYEASGGDEFEPTKRIAEPTAAPAPTPPAAQPHQIANPKAKVAAPAATLTIPTTVLVSRPEPTPQAAQFDIGPATPQQPQTPAPPDNPTRQIDPDMLRLVRGNRVNMRDGPGKRFAIVTTLNRGERLELLQSPGNGWLQLRVIETDEVGWMAEFLVVQAN